MIEFQRCVILLAVGGVSKHASFSSRAFMHITRRRTLGSGVSYAIGAASIAISFPVAAGTERTCAVDVWNRGATAARFRIVATGNVGFVAASMMPVFENADLLYLTDDPADENGRLAESLEMATYSYRTPIDLISVGSGAAGLISWTLKKSTPPELSRNGSRPTCVIVGAPGSADEWRSIAIAAVACRLRGEPVVACVAPCVGGHMDCAYARFVQMETDHFWLFPAESVARSETRAQPGEASWLPHADFLAGVCTGVAKGIFDPTRLACEIDSYWHLNHAPVFQVLET